MKISDIKPNEDNPRFIKEHKFKKVLESIKSFPKMLEIRPIVVDENNIIIGGNMRFKALLELGYEEIPDEWIFQILNLTEEQKKEFIIKDNLPYGQWDWDELANNWNERDLLYWGLDIPMFEQCESSEESEVDEELIESGDIFQLGSSLVIASSVTDKEHIEKLFEGGKEYIQQHINVNRYVDNDFEVCYIVAPDECEIMIQQILDIFPNIEFRKVGNIYDEHM